MPREVNLEKLNKKFSALTKSKDSIQSLSLWIIRHKAFRDEITKEWLKAIRQADMQHRLTLFYLANDVLQNCKRKDAAEYRSSFAQVLENALSYARDEIIKDEVLRLIYIWRERNVFSPVLLKSFQAQVNKEEPMTTSDNDDSPCLTDGEMEENFSPNRFITCLKQLGQPRKKVLDKSNNSNVLSIEEIDRLNLLDIRINCDVRKMYNKLEATSKFLEAKIEREQEINQKNEKMVEIAQAFFSSQHDDVKRVAQAYKIFGKKLNKVKDALNEKMKTLPMDISSPPTSPRKTVLRDDDSHSLVDKTSVAQRQQRENNGITIESNVLFFDQGTQFSNIVTDEKENKRSTTFQDKEKWQTSTKSPVTAEVSTISSEFKMQCEYQSKELDQMSPKHKKLKLETSNTMVEEVVESSSTIKIEVGDGKLEELNPTMSEIKMQEIKHQLKELNRTSQKQKTRSISKAEHRPKVFNKISSNVEVKTEKFECQSDKLTLKLPKQKVKIESKPPVIDLTSPKKLKTEISLVEPKSEELENDLEIIPSPELKVETPRKSFKPIKLNLISSPKPKNKEIEHQPKILNLELLNAKVEHKPHEVGQGLTIKMEINPDFNEVDRESFPKIEIKSEKSEPEESFKIPLIKDFDLNPVKLESEVLCESTNNDCDGLSKTDDDDKSIEIRESGLSKDNFPSLFKQSDEETLNRIFHEDEVLPKMNLDEPIEANAKTESCEENSIPSPVSASSTILQSSKQVLLPSDISPSSKQVPLPSDISPSSKQVSAASNISLSTKQVSVPSNIPPSTKQSLLKSMKVLSFLLSKKVDLKIDSAGQQTTFPLKSMFPIISQNLRSEKNNHHHHPITTEESAILPSQKLVLDNSEHCDVKIERVDTNLELMDMDLDSEDDS